MNISNSLDGPFVFLVLVVVGFVIFLFCFVLNMVWWSSVLPCDSPPNFLFFRLCMVVQI